MSSYSRSTLPATAFTLPSKYYMDSSIFDKEIERFYRRMWVCVGRLEEIGRRGDFLTCDIAGDNVLVVRAGADAAAVRAFSTVCRHRGTRLCADATGTLNGTIQCPYHAWTCDYDGRLLGALHVGAPQGVAR